MTTIQKENKQTEFTELSLAPMAGYTDSVFRRICAERGADYTVSEMISATALVMGDGKTASLAKITEGEGRVVLQIFGHEAETCARAADILLTGEYKGCAYAERPVGIDINMGCPVKKITSNGEGSALMRESENARRIAAAVKNVCVKHGVPMSVKFRSGWDAEHINAPEFAVMLAKEGADRLTLHCRTREQMYAPGADRSIIDKTVQALAEVGLRDGVIFCGNGDVDSPESAADMIKRGCDGVAIGRASLGDPWLFARIKDPTAPPPTPEEIREVMLRLVRELTAEKGEVCGMHESRARAAHFIKGIRGGARLRDALNHCESLKEFEETLGEVVGG